MKYERLHTLSREAEMLKGIASLLDWDHETYMPEGSAHFRAKQLKILAGLEHEKLTSDEYTKALSALIDIKTGKLKEKLIASKKRAVELWRRDYLKRICLPKEFVEEFAELASNAVSVWRSAKEKSSFKEFAPILKKIVALCKKKAELVGYKEHPYDALLDDYEPGMTTSEIKTLFDQVKSFSSALIKKQAKIDDSFLTGDFDPEKQLQFCTEILKDMGYDFKYGRVDFSAHPFSSSCHPTDSRITTRKPGRHIMSTIGTLMHEGGHSLYEMNLPAKEYGSPLGQAVSLGMHESQSRFWEIWIGHSKPFWKRYYPELKKLFKQFEKVPLEAFYKAINKVTPSLIRVESDEVTYPLHVILRFELEKGLIEGSIHVDEIPKLWNKKMKELLGVVPKNDAEGCLQDIHWAMGAFGYFPTYALGNLYAAELFDAFTETHKNYAKKIEKEGLLFVTKFLKERVHKYGRQYDSKNLIKKATGKEFSTVPYLRYLDEKY